jgi:hypothetical protein
MAIPSERPRSGVGRFAHAVTAAAAVGFVAGYDAMAGLEDVVAYWRLEQEDVVAAAACYGPSRDTVERAIGAGDR